MKDIQYIGHSFDIRCTSLIVDDTVDDRMCVFSVYFACDYVHGRAHLVAMKHTLQ